jgi:hypothetical protein
MSFESDELTLSQSPFNDKIADFNDKKYVRIFRLEGRGAPAGEENTNDSLAIKRDRDIVESILGISDGTVVSKNPVIVDGTTITIPVGTQVYARGYVIELDTDATVTIAGSGNEYIVFVDSQPVPRSAFGGSTAKSVRVKNGDFQDVIITEQK